MASRDDWSPFDATGFCLQRIAGQPAPRAPLNVVIHAVQNAQKDVLTAAVASATAMRAAITPQRCSRSLRRYMDGSA